MELGVLDYVNLFLLFLTLFLGIAVLGHYVYTTYWGKYYG